MSVAFDAKDVYEFIFSKDDAVPDVYEVDKKAVDTFCSVLEREITVHSRMNPHYKYVFFSLDYQSIDRFFGENRGRFLDFGSRVVFAGECSKEPARSIELKYGDTVVTDALRKARSQARQMTLVQ